MAHWPTVRLGYDSDDNLKYRGLNATLDASTAAKDWRIWRFVYDSSSNIEAIKGPFIGAWDDRETLC